MDDPKSILNRKIEVPSPPFFSQLLQLRELKLFVCQLEPNRGASSCFLFARQCPDGFWQVMQNSSSAQKHDFHRCLVYLDSSKQRKHEFLRRMCKCRFGSSYYNSNVTQKNYASAVCKLKLGSSKNYPKLTPKEQFCLFKMRKKAFSILVSSSFLFGVARLEYGGRELHVTLGLCDSDISKNEAFGNLESMTIFALLVETCLS